jgi:hypothetical protein
MLPVPCFGLSMGTAVSANEAVPFSLRINEGCPASSASGTVEKSASEVSEGKLAWG